MESNLIRASDRGPVPEPIKRALHILAPRVPGAAPSVIGMADTMDDARRIAADFSRGRRDLTGADVRIERASDGMRIEYAGLGS